MKEQHIYTAGLIDGEGTVGLVSNNHNQHRSPCVSVSSTTPELVKFLKETYGGSVSRHKTYQDHHKPSWSWKVTHDRALSFLEQVSPYLKEPEKIRRASLILSEYKSVTVRNGKYSPTALKVKEDFEYRFFHPSTP